MWTVWLREAHPIDIRAKSFTSTQKQAPITSSTLSSMPGSVMNWGSCRQSGSSAGSVVLVGVLYLWVSDRDTARYSVTT